MGGVARDVVTAWHSEDGGSTWLRTVYSRETRAEVRREQRPGTSGPVWASVVDVWVMGECGIAEGDYLTPKLSAEAEPPEECFRVVAVMPWTLRGRPHHVKVVAE